MGIVDFDSVYDLLDPAQHGSVSWDQVQQYDEVLHLTPLDPAQVQASVEQVCGAGQTRVPRRHFVTVLHDLERRRQVEEQARWDFAGLDPRGGGLISITNAMLLMQIMHGDRFSLGTWNDFLANRGDERRTAGVCFDEIRIWLCNLPSGGQGSSAKDLSTEKNKLEKEGQDGAMKNFSEHKAAVNAENEASKQQLEYEEATKRKAQRKKNIWEHDGVEAMLADTGDEGGVWQREGAMLLPRDGIIGTRELSSIIDRKYYALRCKVLWDMLSQSAGGGGAGKDSWKNLTEEEQQDLHRELLKKEQELRKKNQDGGKLADDIAKLHPGIAVKHDGTLQGIMGDIWDGEKQRKAVRERRMTLRGQGKDHAEIETMLKAEFVKANEVPYRYGDLLIALNARQIAEKKVMGNLMRAKGKKKMSRGQAVVAFCRLLKQQHLIETHSDTKMAATATGLAERKQVYKPSGFDPDRFRFEKVASDLIIQYTMGDLDLVPMETDQRNKDKKKSSLELSVELGAEIYSRHQEEAKALLDLLLGGEHGQQARARVEGLGSEDRENLTITLRNQRTVWRDNPAVYRKKHQEEHQEILLQGSALYYMSCRDQLSRKNQPPAESTVHTTILADLLQQQAIEFDDVMLQSQTTSPDEDPEDVLLHLLHTARAALQERVYDNIAAVTLGSTRWSPGELPVVNAISRKYDALRHLLFLHVLKLDYGIAWDRLTEEEKEKLLQKKKSEEEKLRKTGELQSMAGLLTKLPEDMGSAYSLLGEDKGSYWMRKRRGEEQQQQNAFMGKDITVAFTDETPVDKVATTNMLADIVKRTYAEQDAVIGRLRSHDLGGGGAVAGVLVEVERKRALREEGTDVGMLAVGLLERVTDAAQTRRQGADGGRQQRLAQLRFDARRRRQHLGKAYTKEHDDIPPQKGDMEECMTACLYEMEKKYAEEREQLLSVLQDPSLEDLLEAARMMSKADRQRRLMELQAKHRKLNLDDPDEQDEVVSIIEEAAAIRIVLKHELLQCEGRHASLDDISVILLTELHDQQDAELARLVLKLHRLSGEDLRILREVEIRARHQGSGVNVITVLTKYEGLCNDDEIIQALENKYEALKDKILLEALSEQAGEDGWAKVPDGDKQKQLLQIKLEAKKLHQEGKWDELAVLLGDTVSRERSLRNITWMMGDNRFKYERKLRDRLHNHNADDGEGIEEEDLETLDDDITPFEVLDARKEEEKEALLALVKGLTNEFLSEKERQTELVRMTHGEKRAQRERDFESAAILVGLGERQQTVATESKKTRKGKKTSVGYSPNLMLKNDRRRQERLAVRRLELLQTVDQTKKKKDVKDVVANVSRLKLQELILERLDEKQAAERELLVTFMSDPGHNDLRSLARDMTDTDRVEKREELRDRRAKIAPEKVKDQHAVLLEGTVYRMESVRAELFKQSTTDGDVEEEDVTVAMLADLQELQDLEVETYIQQMPDMNEQDLVGTQRKIVYEKVHQWVECLAQLLLGKDVKAKGTEQEVEAALDRKYQLLRDRLFEDALKLQVGESSWKTMSAIDQQKKLRELRQQEKKYREARDFDKAITLIGSLEADSPMQLLSATTSDRARAAEEKAQRKRDREADGFTAAEIKQLEEDDAERERKGSGNVLKEVVDCYNAERSHFRRVVQSGDVALSRAVHNALVYIQWEMARMHNEPVYASALLSIATVRDPDFSGFDREIQERLASKRLELRKANPSVPSHDLIPMPSDLDDLSELGQAVVREMEAKYQEEREFIIKLLESDPDVRHYQSSLQQMSRSERQGKREQIINKLQQLQDGDVQRQEDIMIIKETVALALEFLSEAAAMEGVSSSQSDHQVALLANLQDIQDREAHVLVKAIPAKDAATLVQLKTVLAGRHSRKDCVVRALLEGLRESPTDQTSQELDHGTGEVIATLEAKYDAMRDKLFGEALLREMGEDEWNNLSEAERQRLILERKLREKNLRSEGKHEEANALIGDSLGDDEDLNQLLGETHAEQEQRSLDRLKRKKALMKTRQEQGLSTEDPVLEAILDEQDEEQGQGKKKRNLLGDIWRHFEAEKAALLAELAACEDHAEAERKRQGTKAKLGRDVRRLRNEETLEGCALLLRPSHDQAKIREAHMAAEKERQLQLARTRLAARRKAGRQQGDQGNPKLILQLMQQQTQAEEERDADTLWKINTQGVGALHEALLNDVELKHEQERNTLLSLIDDVQTDKDTQDLLANTQPQEHRLQLERLRQERSRWNVTSQKAAAVFLEQHGDMTAQEIDDYMSQLAKSRSQQHGLLTKAVGLKLQMEQPSLSSDASEQEAAAILLADLQQKQHAEIVGIHKLLNTQGEELLRQVQATQRVSVREGWLENVVHTVFAVRSAGSDSDGADMLGESMDGAGMDGPKIPDVPRLAKEMEEEVDKDMEEKLKKCRGEMSEQDFEVMKSRLLAEKEAKVQAINVSLEKQRKMAIQKFESRRQAREQKEYEQDAILNLMRVSKREQSFIINDLNKQKGRQHQVMQERIESRRLQRLKDRPASATRLRSRETTRIGSGQRRKSVPSVGLSAEQKDELYQQLVREQAARSRKLDLEQKRSEEQVQRRLQDMKQRRHGAATHILTTAAKEKSVVEAGKREDRERQISRTKERLERLRHEKTRNMKEKGAKSARHFDKLLQETADVSASAVATLTAAGVTGGEDGREGSSKRPESE